MKHTVLFGLIYTIVYWFLAILNVGPEGTGTTIFFAPLIAWLGLFVALFLVNKLDDLRNRIFFVGVMVLHYGLTLLFLYAALNSVYREKSNLTRALEHEGLMWVTIAWYLLGQVFIWMSFLRCQNNSQV